MLIAQCETVSAAFFSSILCFSTFSFLHGHTFTHWHDHTFTFTFCRCTLASSHAISYISAFSWKAQVFSKQSCHTASLARFSNLEGSDFLSETKSLCPRSRCLQPRAHSCLWNCFARRDRRKCPAAKRSYNWVGVNGSFAQVLHHGHFHANNLIRIQQLLGWLRLDGRGDKAAIEQKSLTWCCR
jgi:hypothetical protein